SAAYAVLGRVAHRLANAESLPPVAHRRRPAEPRPAGAALGFTRTKSVGMRPKETIMWYRALGCLVTLTLSLLAAPLAAAAQPSAKVARIGISPRPGALDRPWRRRSARGCRTLATWRARPW